MSGHVEATALDAALLARAGWLERAGRRWRGLAHVGALAFVTMLYSNPMYWWPVFERYRLGYVTAAVTAAAVIVHRVVTGERIRVGGWGSIPLFAYWAFIPMSLAWTMNAEETWLQVVEGAKIVVIFVAIQNAVDSRARLRRFMAVATLAALGPALGAIHVWQTDDALIDGFRTHWRGMYGDPNRLAMSIIAVLPFAMYWVFAARRRWVKVLFAAAVAAHVTAIVLTHSRSGAIGAGIAVLLFAFRGKGGTIRGGLAAAAVAVGVLTLAPTTFWQRSRTLGDLEEDESVRGREHAWKVLAVVVEERPLTGVGAGAFLTSWGRYAPLEAGGHRYVAHNILLEIVGDLGIVAFLLWTAYASSLLWRLWRAGRDPLVGPEARAILAGLAGYLLVEMANGYSLSWFMYFLFACAASVMRLAHIRATLAGEGT